MKTLDGSSLQLKDFFNFLTSQSQQFYSGHVRLGGWGGEASASSHGEAGKPIFSPVGEKKTNAAAAALARMPEERGKKRKLVRAGEQAEGRRGTPLE